MPRQGQSVEACTIVRWLKQPGENVGSGEVLCEIETDKAAFEVESTASGTLLAQFAPEGEEVPVLTPIAAVGEPGEAVPTPSATDTPALAAADGGSTPAAGGASGAGPGASPPAAPAPVAAPGAAVPDPAGTGAPGAAAEASVAATGAAASTRRGGPAISPRARRRAGELGVDYATVSGSGPRGRIIERDVVAAAAARPALTAAARAAVAAGAEVPAVGSGIGGRVTLADLAAPAVPAAPAAPAGVEAVAPEQVESVPVTGVRRLISERMRQSLLDTAQLTMHASADAEALVAYRARLKSSAEHLQLGQVTINDLILFAVARTLPQFPQLNAVVRGDAGGDRIERHRDVHLAFAVDTERGLVVPVINAAHQLSIAGLAARAHELAAATQAGSISPDLLQGGTFTVTNLGALGVESFTPILNLPQVAILGVGALALKPVAADLTQPGPPQEVSYRRHLGLSLTIDHRVVDGAPAARFLQALAAAIADIDLLAAL